MLPPAPAYADNDYSVVTVPIDRLMEEPPPPQATPILEPVPEDLPQEMPPQIEREPAYRVVRVRVLVTACSPEDAIDRDYYARHGYEGATYNIAADLSVFPRGTRIRVPGYMDVSYPDRFWSVDSSGGSIIRNATRRGILQVDVKYRTEYSALRWGRQWLTVEVQIPPGRDGERLLRRLQPHIVR